MVLLEAAYYGDKAAADRCQVSERSIRNWRQRLEIDPEFAAVFQAKKLRWEQDWASELPAALRAFLGFLVRASKEGNHRDPEMVHAIAGAFKLVADAGFAKAILDVKLAESGAILAEYGGSVAGEIAETSEGD